MRSEKDRVDNRKVIYSKRLLNHQKRLFIFTLCLYAIIGTLYIINDYYSSNIDSNLENQVVEKSISFSKDVIHSEQNNNDEVKIRPDQFLEISNETEIEDNTGVEEKIDNITNDIVRNLSNTINSNENNAEDIKYIALTFDDGPHDSVTVQILDVLNEYDAKATFFVLGERVKKYPDVLNLIIEQGSEIGNHSWSHVEFTDLTPKEMLKEFNDTQDIIHSSTNGYVSKLFRPPYGSYNSMVIETIPVPIILWSVDSLDWSNRDSEMIKENILSNVENGAIVIQHDLYEANIDALRVVLAELSTEGYKFVTVSQMLELTSR